MGRHRTIASPSFSACARYATGVACLHKKGVPTRKDDRDESDQVCQLSPPLPPDMSRLTDNGEGSLAARGYPFFKISLGLFHLVRHVGKTAEFPASRSAR